MTRNPVAPMFVSSAVRNGVVLMCALVAIAGCSANGPLVARPSPSHSPSPSPSPSEIPSPTPTPSPSPMPSPSPVVVPAWAALRASCTGSATPHEALLTMQGSANLIIADVTDPKNPKPICTISGGSGQPQIVTQSMVSWYATQGTAGATGTSMIAALDLFGGTSTVAASWQGGSFMDGLHAWSPDRGFLAYVTSDATAVSLHLLSGGGARVVATMGAVPGRGTNPNEDDAYLAFSPDGAFFALEQTWTGSGDQLQVRRTFDGSPIF